MNTIKISSLANDVEIWVDDWYYSVWNVWEYINHIKENKEWVNKYTIYVLEYEDMPTPTTSFIIDWICEHMDENHEEWSDKNTDYIKILQNMVDNVIADWWDLLHKWNANTIFSKKTKVLYDI